MYRASLTMASTICSGLRPSAITLVDLRTSDITWASLPLA